MEHQRPWRSITHAQSIGRENQLGVRPSIRAGTRLDPTRLGLNYLARGTIAWKAREVLVHRHRRMIDPKSLQGPENIRRFHNFMGSLCESTFIEVRFSSGTFASAVIHSSKAGRLVHAFGSTRCDMRFIADNEAKLQALIKAVTAKEGARLAFSSRSTSSLSGSESRRMSSAFHRGHH